MSERPNATADVPCAFCAALNRVDMTRVDDRPKCGECGKPILLDRPIKLTAATLEKVVGGSQVTVLVDFHADWCAPCKAMAPTLDAVARDRRGSVVVGKLDTDANPAMAEKYGIRGIPTLIVFRGGQEVARQTGAVPRAGLDALLDQARES